MYKRSRTDAKGLIMCQLTTMSFLSSKCHTSSLNICLDCDKVRFFSIIEKIQTANGPILRYMYMRSRTDAKGLIMCQLTTMSFLSSKFPTSSLNICVDCDKLRFFWILEKIQTANGPILRYAYMRSGTDAKGLIMCQLTTMSFLSSQCHTSSLNICLDCDKLRFFWILEKIQTANGPILRYAYMRSRTDAKGLIMCQLTTMSFLSSQCHTSSLNICLDCDKLRFFWILEKNQTANGPILRYAYMRSGTDAKGLIMCQLTTMSFLSSQCHTSSLNICLDWDLYFTQ